MRRTLPLALLVLIAVTADARPPARNGRSRLLASTPTIARRYSQAVKLLDGTVLVTGGYAPGPSGDPPVNGQKNIDRFDPVTETFAHVADDAIVRTHHQATRLADGRVLITGGADYPGSSGVPTANCRIFDPPTNTVSAAASLLTPRFNHTATLLADGRVLVAGGSNASLRDLPAAELYDPSANMWSAAGNLQRGRNAHSAVLLASGKVLIAGGQGTEAFRMELYDPATNTFALGPTGSSRQRINLTRLTDGRVVLIGGYLAGGDGGEGDFQVRIYDPATNTVAGGGLMAYSCGGCTTALLPDGRIFAAGDELWGEDGQAGSSPIIQRGSLEAQVYDPVARRGTAVRNLRKPRKLSPVVLLDSGNVLIVSGDTDAAWQNAEIWEPALLGSTRGDVDHTLRGDIIWNNPNTNETRYWSMNGFAGNSEFFVGGPDVTVDAPGDFSGGGTTDLLVRRPDTTFGLRGFYERPSDGTLQLLSRFFGSTFFHLQFQPAQMILRPRDMDGDGREDIFTFDAGTGRTWIWFTQHRGFRELGMLPLVEEAGWFIAAVDDFDADGNADVLWRHGTRGENYIWFIDGSNPPQLTISPFNRPYQLQVPRAGHTVPVPDQNYQVRGTGDFNGDGKADLLWRNDATGHTIAWLMDGVNANGAPVPAPGAGWDFITALDFDGDEKQDVLWRNPGTGENAICLMNGFSATCAGIPTVSQAGWRVIAP